MKAAVFKGAGQLLQIDSLADPVPGTGELVLHVARCGICGTDLHMTDGHAATYPLNAVLGHEFVGEVVAMGAGVDGFKRGDLVAGLAVAGCGACASCLGGEPMWCAKGFFPAMGGFAQYNTVRSTAAIKLPAGFSITDGALIEPLAVGLQGVRLGAVGPGNRVLILGSGAVGLAVAYWSQRSGAKHIVVSSRSTRAAEHARLMGAAHFRTFGPDFINEVNGALGGVPDVVFECIGMPGMLAMAVDAAAPRGTIVLLGNCMLPDTLVPAGILFKQLRIQGSMIYSRRDFEIVADTLDAGHVEPRTMITDTVSPDALPAAFESLRRPSDQCKVLVDPWR